jgi:glycosyltransferase involved in cell wall biosynthesis
VRRFASLSPFLEAGTAERRIGRLVANHDFVKALVRHGSFDEYVLANPSVTNQRAFLEAVDTWGLDTAQRARLRPIPLVDLPGVLAADPIDVVHVGGWGAFMPGLHRLRARHARHPFPITGMIFSIHGRDVVDYALRLTHAGLAPCDGIACLSRDGRDAFARLLDHASAVTGRRFAGELVPLPLGVDDDFVAATGDREAGRRRLQLAADTVTLLVLGRLTPSQKMDLAPFLKTVAQRVVPRSPRPLALVLAGGATDADVQLLHELVAAYGLRDRVRVHANFLSRVKGDLLAASDVVVSVTDNTQETFGLGLLEAFAYARPVIASRFDGYKDLVEDGVDGYLVDTWWCEADPLADLVEVMDPNVAQLVQAQSVAVDLTQLADRILTLIEDEPRRRAMGLAGREKVRTRYRFSAVIREYEAWWSQLRARLRRDGLGAATTPPLPEPSAPAIFASYPSRMLAGHELVRARPDAIVDPPYTDVAPLLDAALLRAVLAAAASPTPLSRLVELAPTPQRGWFVVMWLLKYDLLERA